MKINCYLIVVRTRFIKSLFQNTNIRYINCNINFLFRFYPYAELIIFRTQNDQYSGIDWELDQQRLYTEGDRTFDVLEIRVTAFTDADWEYLANDWETNHQYENDEGGLKQHKKERLLRTCYYDAQFWFDITSFYGKSGIVE